MPVIAACVALVLLGVQIVMHQDARAVPGNAGGSPGDILTA
jgi:hypothetical protein